MNVRRNALPMTSIAMLLSGFCLAAPPGAALAAQPSAGSAQPDSRTTPRANAPSAHSHENDSSHQSAPAVQPPMTKQQKSREMPLPGQSQDHSATNLDKRK
jgi:hypothetical protein